MATESLKSILSDIRACKMVLPQFQRDFVWHPSAVIKLLNSLFNGYPIGALLLMENNENYDYRPIDGVPPKDVKNEGETVLVLDGQQRLTACFRAFFGTQEISFKHPGRYYFRYSAYVEMVEESDDFENSSIEDLIIFLRPAQIAKMGLHNTAKEISDGLFPLDILFGEPRGSNYADWLNNFNFMTSGGNREEFTKLSRVSSKFQTDFIEKVTAYQVNFEKITRETRSDVICTVFETINTTGVKLTVFDLLVAKCFKNDIRLRDKLDDALARFSNIRFFDESGTSIATTQLPKLIGLLHNGQCKKGDILRLKPEVIKENWDTAISAMDRMLGLMKDEMGCLKREFLPSVDAIAPLAIILGDLNFNRAAHMDAFKKVYWCIVFSQYLSGAPESKSARLLREWKDVYWNKTAREDDFLRSFAFTIDEITDATRASAVYKGIMTLLIARGARDFSPKLQELRGARNKVIEDHHIFPQQFLRTFDIKGARANGILNRTPIFADTNRYISSTAPEVYFEDERVVSKPTDLLEIAKVHFFDAELVQRPFSKELFDEFCEDRQIRLTKLISETTGVYFVDPDEVRD
ncbi:hypothetical protein RHAL1_03741 [Beijerinckiaceae bacterium RH AL1]|nr:DUF262 domain-containing protein [Beijerinckiaceae bacterium]VVB49254.1 hypothetical protein RHCH11_RHCH11_03668 [Beijerinckiaceae bacterium RH CH11]VVB49333.1 hypothetical protein RHAL8_03664 [Beijerinckiaceae bacterium RH AL8]VVC56809.1 hypothetical protein RHAL1_03741 [Beijerinckiaceae bacterium RH AL1]